MPCVWRWRLAAALGELEQFGLSVRVDLVGVHPRSDRDSFEYTSTQVSIRPRHYNACVFVVVARTYV